MEGKSGTAGVTHQNSEAARVTKLYGNNSIAGKTEQYNTIIRMVTGTLFYCRLLINITSIYILLRFLSSRLFKTVIFLAEMAMMSSRDGLTSDAATQSLSSKPFVSTSK